MRQILLTLLALLLLPSCNKGEESSLVEMPKDMDEKIQMVVAGRTFIVSLYDNPTAKAFLALLPMTIYMDEMNGNEKYYHLPGSMPVAAERKTTIDSGDIMLYGSRTLVLFYETFSSSYSYTKIAKVDNPTSLKVALGATGVDIKFELLETL